MTDSSSNSRPASVPGQDFVFHYADILIEPYIKENKSSHHLLKEVIEKITSTPNNKKLKDRHKGRKDADARRLVMLSATFNPLDKRCYGKMALLKNKAPALWQQDTDIVEEIQKEENKSFIEQTNFCIDFSGKVRPIIMYEFNNEGPRLSDIEYYIRQFLKEESIGKSIKTVIHLNKEISDLSSKIKNIFNVYFKVKSGAIHSDSNWLKPFKEIKDQTAFKDIKMELFFVRAKDETGKFKPNISGLKFVREILDWLNKTPTNLEKMEDLYMEYQVDGSEEVIDLDFITNKNTSKLFVRYTSGQKFSVTDYRAIIGQEFSNYLSSGKTNQDA